MYKFARLVLIAFLIVFFTVSFAKTIRFKETKVYTDPKTASLIEQNHEKVIVRKWISKNIPYYPNLVAKESNKSKLSIGTIQNPFLSYAKEQNNKAHAFKAKWKVVDHNKSNLQPTSTNNSNNSKIISYNKKNPLISKSVAMTSIYNEVEPSSRKIDLVLVRKAMHRMELIKDHKVFKKYHIAIGKNPIGKKEKRSDNRTPEGKYVLDYKRPYSQYHLAVHISYPNKEDLEQAKKNKADPGGMIFIHGQPNEIGRSEDDLEDGNINFNKFIQPSNWTNGCIALINSDMYEFYNIVEPGTPIEILP